MVGCLTILYFLMYSIKKKELVLILICTWKSNKNVDIKLCAHDAFLEKLQVRMKHEEKILESLIILNRAAKIN